MGVSEFSVAITRFRELLLFIIQLQDRKSVLEHLTRQDCEQITKAYQDLAEVSRILNKPAAKRSKR